MSLECETESHADICHSQQGVGGISWCWCLLQLQSRRTSCLPQGYRRDVHFSSVWFLKKMTHFLSVAAFMSSQDIQVAQCWGFICRCALKDDVPVQRKGEKNLTTTNTATNIAGINITIDTINATIITTINTTAKLPVLILPLLPLLPMPVLLPALALCLIILLVILLPKRLLLLLLLSQCYCHYYYFLTITNSSTIQWTISMLSNVNVPVCSQNSEYSTLICNFLRYLQIKREFLFYRHGGAKSEWQTHDITWPTPNINFVG